MATKTVAPIPKSIVARKHETNDLELQENIQRCLPYVDLETGIKNRVLTRDPIAGLGNLPAECSHFDGTRIPKLNLRAHNTRDPIRGVGELGEEYSGLNSYRQMKQKQDRNPITLAGNLGNEVDRLRTTARPRTGIPKDPLRNPISGNGDFGAKEWDPVWKYRGKIRRAKSASDPSNKPASIKDVEDDIPAQDRSNPITGENAQSFSLTIEDSKRSTRMDGASRRDTRNAVTGENCPSYVITAEMKDKGARPPCERNAITGQQCSTYDINVESTRPKGKSQTPRLSSNPLLGKNCETFVYMRESKDRPSKPYVYANTVTGENRPHYKITHIERPITARPSAEFSNPLNGENVDTYTYRPGEKRACAKGRGDRVNPLTGEGNRDTYCVSVEERRVTGSASFSNGGGGFAAVGAGGGGDAGGGRNVLTGENCSTFYINREMRSERKSTSANGFYNASGSLSAPITPPSTRRLPSEKSYNIITGEGK